MIFVTLGTDHHPFTRLVNWISEAIDASVIAEPVVIQNGFTPVNDRRLETHEMIGFDQMMRHFEEASVVITHASSTAMLVCHHRRRPIVVPRNPSLGEHVDDHQREFIQATRDVYPFFVANTRSEFFEGLSNKAGASAWNGNFEVGGKEAIRRFRQEFDGLFDGPR